ncbi:hypothetical protein DAEQUDRAFT_721098 [Daedalea quercina L-15889]|uniref:G domain-containing protein n=1 Tax=Daedalea quercina L-15889 TaxID=1314783 RepID=A0A165U0C0_9APHY|nr:hypothetical protein DAEQUDRAFT_721098 [Daedalea quercina L-15889]
MASHTANTPGTSTAINEHNVVGDDRGNEAGVTAPEANEEGERRSDAMSAIPMGVTANFPLDDTPLILDEGKENILVIGETGCGKTTFINFAANVELPVGHTSLERCTKTIQSATFQLQDGSAPVVLYDVPDVGTEKDEPGLRSARGQIVPVDHNQQPAWTAVIYIINITKKRADLSTEDNFQVLKDLEKRQRIHKLLFLVSEWPRDGDNSHQIASERLKEYEGTYLQTYLSRGAKVHKLSQFKLEELDNNRKLEDLQTNARTVVEALLQSSFTAKVVDVEVPKLKGKVRWNCRRLLSVLFKWLRRDS